MPTHASRIPDIRPLSEQERRLLRWMVEESSGIGSGLLAQLERTRVAARCGCGCASIDLAVDGIEEDKKEPMDLIADYAWKTKADIAPFFNQGTEGAMIHSKILAAAPDAPVVIKHYADSFVETELERVLSQHGIGELHVCGMMTQNCVTHTAISKSAEEYKVSILTDCCTTVSEPIHLIALHAVSTRVPLVSSKDAI